MSTTQDNGGEMKGKRQTSLRHIGFLAFESAAGAITACFCTIPLLWFSVFPRTGANIVQMFFISVVLVSVPAMAVCTLMMVDARRREWLATGTVSRDGAWRRWRNRAFIVWLCCLGGLVLTVASFWRGLLAHLPSLP